MRNLKLLNCIAVETEVSDTLCLTVDVETGVTFSCTSDEIVAVNLQSGEVLSKVSILPEIPEEKSTPLGLEYLFDQRAVCVATSDGRLCLWQYDMDCQLEVVGEVPQGITAMSWSPDYELVIIATGDNKLLMMTSEFDVITEMSLFPDQHGEDSNVAVGWGKKETQFHGSAGKQAAKVEHVKIHPASDRDDRRPRVSWRGDGQFFAVSAIEPDTGGRFVYTWSRECAFQAKSEAVDGLQHSLCWKPSGSLIASVQTKHHTNAQEVVFFEKNGLRHGEFTLSPISEHDFVVQQIMWNQNSTILALHIDDYDGNQRLAGSNIQLWTVNNYHWYLKQSLRFDAGLSAARWDAENPGRLQVVTRAGRILSYCWAWTTDHTLGGLKTDLSVVVVIDGAKLLVTPLRKMLVPPPMAAFTLTCPASVNGVTFDPCPGSNNMMALLCTGQVALFEFHGTKDVSVASGDGFKPCLDEPVLKWTYDIRIPDVGPSPTSLSHLLWVSEKTVIMAAQGNSPLTSELVIGEVMPEESAIVVSDKVPVSSVILDLAINQNSKTVAVELANGDILKFIPATRVLTPWVTNQGDIVKFPSPCTQIALALVGGEEVVLGLTERFRFFVNNTEVASNCTSFGIHNDFLLLTTLSHTLRCLPTSLKPTDLPRLSEEKAHPFDESSRRVERGSRIVSVVGDGTQVVLQMPRGNLETIHPRALLISSLKKLMDGGQTREAFIVIRKHRINMNLLHDHNPKYFLDNVDNFIGAVDNQSYLNVFLTDLIEEDVTLTMYSASYAQETNLDREVKLHQASKVDTICDAFLAAFQRLGVKKHIQSVLTAYARKTVPELEKALLLVWSLHGEEGNSAEAALKYLLFLVDVNMLYDIALGTYNFDLVMMVAQQSQKDPKEYIPFLNQLRRLEDNYRYFSIDKYLKKYSKALEHIAKCGNDHFEECVNLVSDHKLYGQALRIYKPGSMQFKRLATIYGNYLLTKNRNEEAGIEFVKAEEWDMAIDAFQKASDWQQVFCMAHRLEYSASQLSELATKISGDLKSRQKYQEASTVLVEYAQDYEEAIVALIEGYHWKEALRQMYRFKRLDLIDTHLLEALQESWEHHKEMLASQREQFERHKTRLHTVRAQKEKAAAELLEGTADYNDAEADLFSDTTSMTGASVSSLVSSNSSRSTIFTKGTGSSRTRRKADNKRWSLKEGSANEEFALVDAQAKIIKAVDGMKDDIGHLLKMLVQFNFDRKAVELQEMYNSFLQLLQGAIPDIWTYTQKPTTSMSLGPNMTANAVAQALQRGQPLQAEEEKLDPVLLAPPVLNKDTRWKLHTSSDQDR